jgi:hypothetical protein
MENAWTSLVLLCEESGNDVVKCLRGSGRMRVVPNPLGATENAHDARGKVNKNKLEDRNARAIV